jgi:hypothetical protein
VLSGFQHGKPEEGNYNVGMTFLALIIEVTLLYFAGFWVVCFRAGVLAALYLLALVMSFINHGKPRTGKTNFLTTLIVNGLKVALVVSVVLQVRTPVLI